MPRTVLINPVLTPLSVEVEDDWEGCLSVPSLRGVVPRWKQLRYEGYDPLGGYIVREVDGFHARVVQHETDHLDGILYPMRVQDMRRFGFTDITSTRSARSSTATCRWAPSSTVPAATRPR